MVLGPIKKKNENCHQKILNRYGQQEDLVRALFEWTKLSRKNRVP